MSSTPRVHKKTALQIEFGKLLRRKRQELNLTQQELAEKADLDSTYISSIERGERNVSLGNLIALATALNIEPQELIPHNPLDPKVQTRIELGKRLKKIRERKKMTQEELAKKTNLTTGYIALLELGKKEINFENVIAIAHALQVSLKQLIPEAGS